MKLPPLYNLALFDMTNSLCLLGGAVGLSQYLDEGAESNRAV